LFDGVAFDHRRPAINDVSHPSRQAMMSANSRYIITSNGEVNSIPALRRELEQSGTEIRCHSDTEIVLASIEARGFEATPWRPA